MPPENVRSDHPSPLPLAQRLLRRAEAVLGSPRRRRQPREHATSPVMDEAWPSDIDPPEGTLGDGAPPAGASGRTPYGAAPGSATAGGTTETQTNTLPG